MNEVTIEAGDAVWKQAAGVTVTSLSAGLRHASADCVSPHFVLAP